MTVLPEWSPQRVGVFPARLRGVEVQCAVAVNRQEHERRQRWGVGAVKDREVLEVLLGLEPDVETARCAVSARAGRVLRQAQGGSVIHSRRTVTRTARVPVTVTLVTVSDTQPGRGLSRASMFGPYCMRVLSLSRLPVDPAELLLEASYLGIGIAVPEDPQVVPAAAFRAPRFTGASWMFAEAAYGQWLQHTSRTIRHAPRPARVRVIGDLFHGRIPPGAVYVGRGAPGLPASPYANRHRVGSCRICRVTHNRAEAVAAYRRDLDADPTQVAAIREDLAGRDLACWCPLDGQPCHGEVLITLANPTSTDGTWRIQ